MAQPKGDTFRVYQQFQHEAVGSQRSGKSNPEHLEKIFNKYKSRLHKEGQLAARAYMAYRAGQQYLAKVLARKLQNSEPSFKEAGRMILVYMDERILPQPDGLYSADGTFNYDVAARNYRLVAEGHKKKTIPTSYWWQALQDTYPPAFRKAFEALIKKESVDFDPLWQFLEADPYFFRSGYVKADLLRLLKQRVEELTTAQRARLQRIILKALNSWPRREFPYYLRLARKLADPVFAEQLRFLLNSDICIFGSQVAAGLKAVEESLHLQGLGS